MAEAPRLRSSMKLRAFPNPYAALDADGMPSGAFRYDPDHGMPNAIHFVGVVVTRTQVPPPKGEKPRQFKKEGRFPLVKLTFAYDFSAPTDLPHSDYFVRALRVTGPRDLIIADAATAAIVGVPFEDPQKVLEGERSAAIMRWNRQYGTNPPVERWAAYAIGAGAATDTAPAVSAPAAAPEAASAPRAPDALDHAMLELGETLPAHLSEIGMLGQIAEEALGGDRDAAALAILSLGGFYLTTGMRSATLATLKIEVRDGAGAPLAPSAVLGAVLRVAHHAPDDLPLLTPARCLPLIERLRKVYEEGGARGASFDEALAAEAVVAALTPR